MSVITLTTDFGAGSPYVAAMKGVILSIIPGATPEQMDWFNELQRMTTSPENAAKLLSAFGDIDVANRLRLVTQ